MCEGFFIEMDIVSPKLCTWIVGNRATFFAHGAGEDDINAEMGAVPLDADVAVPVGIRKCILVGELESAVEQVFEGDALGDTFALCEIMESCPGDDVQAKGHRF